MNIENFMTLLLLLTVKISLLISCSLCNAFFLLSSVTPENIDVTLEAFHIHFPRFRNVRVCLTTLKKKKKIYSQKNTKMYANDKAIMAHSQVRYISPNDVNGHYNTVAYIQLTQHFRYVLYF